MNNIKGVYTAKKKDGTIYYRASITYKNKHISLGSFLESELAHKAYLEAKDILFHNLYNYKDYNENMTLSFEKWIILHNFRDSGIYIKNPIYLHKYYFSYYLDINTELKFDVDDLFYYSNHKIFKRSGYLFVNDYGMQINILSRYGIKNFAVLGKDYYFKDGDLTNYRYHNIIVINKYYGVNKIIKKNRIKFRVKINIKGKLTIGEYNNEDIAAIAYNKAADFINNNNISSKKYLRNYIDSFSPIQYKEAYEKIKLPKKLYNMLP